MVLVSVFARDVNADAVVVVGIADAVGVVIALSHVE